MVADVAPTELGIFFGGCSTKISRRWRWVALVSKPAVSADFQIGGADDGGRQV